MITKAIINSVCVRADENAITGSFDVDVSIMLDGIVYTARQVASIRIRDMRGTEAVFDELVLMASRRVKALIKGTP